MRQSDALKRSEQHMALLAWKNDDITMIELKQFLDKAFAAEHARLLAELREKKQNYLPFTTASNVVPAIPLAAIDAEIERLKGGAGK